MDFASALSRLRPRSRGDARVSSPHRAMLVNSICVSLRAELFLALLFLVDCKIPLIDSLIVDSRSMKLGFAEVAKAQKSEYMIAGTT
jgi:hypothetical protein